MEKTKTIWYDFTNVPHVNFLLPIIKHYKAVNKLFSIRDFAETKGLFDKEIGEPRLVVGSHQGGLKLMKVFGSLKRVYLLNTEHRRKARHALSPGRER